MILNRLCFFERVGGTVRPHEWSFIMDDNLGPMVEPFWPFPTANNANDDFSTANDFQRVDNFREVGSDVDMLRTINCGDISPWIHGGRHYSRSGR